MKDCKHGYQPDCCTQCEWKRERRVLKAAIKWEKWWNGPPTNTPAAIINELANSVRAYLRNGGRK